MRGFNKEKSQSLSGGKTKNATSPGKHTSIGPTSQAQNRAANVAKISLIDLVWGSNVLDSI